MRYSPDPVPFDVNAIPAYLQREFAKIQATINEIETEERNTVPDRLREGLVVRADGVNWNPGSGAGVYCYYNSAWHYLG